MATLPVRSNLTVSREMLRQPRRNQLRISKLSLTLIAVPLALVPAAALANDGEGGSNDPTIVLDSSGTDTTELELAVGADYSVGKYGASADTTVWSLPVELKYRAGPFRISASLPWVSIEGPGRVVGGVVVFDPASPTPVRSNGLGDLSLSAGYLLNNESGVLPAFELGATAKVPTASTQIGTGEMDWSVQVTGFKTVAPGTMLFGSVGYSWLGSPAAYQLSNGVTATAGINHQPSTATNLGLSYSYREPVAAGLESQQVISPYVTHRFSSRIGITLYGMAGLNDASPRLGAGLRLSLFN